MNFEKGLIMIALIGYWFILIYLFWNIFTFIQGVIGSLAYFGLILAILGYVDIKTTKTKRYRGN